KGGAARGRGVCRVFAGRRLAARRPHPGGGPATASDHTARAEAAAGAPAGRRLADSHLASPTAMHAVGPPPFPRWPQVMSGGWGRASELPAGRAAGARAHRRKQVPAGGRRGAPAERGEAARPPAAQEAPACPNLGAMTQAWDKELRARGYRVTPQRQLVLEAVTKLEHATPEEIWADVQQTASGV